jgi:hypothetical protein
VARARETGPQAGGQLGAEDLDGHLAIMLQVLGQVDRGHAAAADLVLDGVSVSEGLSEALERSVHG